MACSDPKMQIFYRNADELLASNKTFKEILSIPCRVFHRNTTFIELDKSGKRRTTSYKQYYKNCFLFASSVSKKLNDIEKGSYVALKGNNSTNWIYTFWGLIIAGYNPVLINPILLKKDVNILLKESGAKAIIIDSEEKFDIPTFSMGEFYFDKEQLQNENWGTKIAFCTSGTTGQSRIYVFTDKNMVYQIYGAYPMPDTTKTIMYDVNNLRLISIIPFAHIFGFTAVFFWYTFFGRTIVFPKSMQPEVLVETCKKEKISHVYAVPLFFTRIAKQFNDSISKQTEKKQELINRVMAYYNKDITVTEAGIASSKFVISKIQKMVLGNAIKHCISGGAPISRETLRTFNGINYPLYNGYGMTEIGITSVELSPDSVQRNKCSIGKALANVEYKVVNDELLVKSPQIHSYCLINGQEVKAQIGDDGYFHTGDVAVIQEDGYTFLKGKTKDIIIGSNGENIYPDEIEIHFENLPYIKQQSVIGIDDILTLVVSVDSKLSEDQIKEIENKIMDINDSLPMAMRIKTCLLATEGLPLNSSLKVKKYQLIDDIKNKPECFVRLGKGKVISFDGFDKNLVDQTIAQLTDIFADILFKNKEEIAPNNHLILELGGDSFSYMSIIASVENEFKIKIPTELIGKLNTVNEFALFILKNKDN